MDETYRHICLGLLVGCTCYQTSTSTNIYTYLFQNLTGCTTTTLLGAQDPGWQ